MAKKYPHSYGGDSFKKQPNIHHTEVDTKSIDPQFSHTLEDDTSGFVDSACALMCTTIRWCSTQFGKYMYPYNYTKQDDPLIKEQSKQFAPIFYKPIVTECCINEGKYIFNILQNCYSVDKNKLELIAVEYNWMERHLKLEQGLNLLADCKNCDCKHFMQGVVCPRGMFRDRNGYCPLDMEMYKAKCPTCKQKISPDESFGFGFYDCDFQITYKLVEQKKHIMIQKGSENVFYFRKLSVSCNVFKYLEGKIALYTQV